MAPPYSVKHVPPWRASAVYLWRGTFPSFSFSFRRLAEPSILKFRFSYRPRKQGTRQSHLAPSSKFARTPPHTAVSPENRGQRWILILWSAHDWFPPVRRISHKPYQYSHQKILRKEAHHYRSLRSPRVLRPQHQLSNPQNSLYTLMMSTKQFN